MNGQWMGQYVGTSPGGSNTGSIIVNIDDMGDHYEGVAFLINADNRLPGVVAILKTDNKSNVFQIKTSIIFSIHPKTNFRVEWENVKAFYPDVVFPKSADVNGHYDSEKLIINWSTDIGTTGSATLPVSKANTPSECEPLFMDWDSYKTYVSGLEGRRFLFRGQSKPWRLRTKFHRTGRAELGRFSSQDIPTLHKHLSARTRHIFNLGIGDENGAFYNLVQHHGYPTPLLDWTYSPYVAAFFAYREISNLEATKAEDNRKVRIIVLDQKNWRKDWPQIQFLDLASPHFSIMEFIAIDNERMIPQQSASSVTNVDDIEGYIHSKETDGKKYLHTIDLPLKQRPKIMSELSYMGITAGSLFPGLDGACEELKERFFEKLI